MSKLVFLIFKIRNVILFLKLVNVKLKLVQLIEFFITTLFIDKN